MAFYISPPAGRISLPKFLYFGQERLLFLHKLCSNNGNDFQHLFEETETVKISECLIEGTAKDKVSHFLLRIACIEDAKMRDFFIRAETLLFHLRMEFQDMYNIRKIMNSVYQQFLKVSSRENFIYESYKQCLLTLLYVRDQVEALDNECAITQEIRVPFIHALDFVQRRLVPLQHGFVLIPTRQIKILLTSLFEQTLVEGLKHLKTSAIMVDIVEDSRIGALCNKLKLLFRKLTYRPEKILRKENMLLHSDLDAASEKFPLCMRHLHHILRTRHRLKHKSRIQYILFLKDIGLPLEEAIKLFEKEYSNPCASDKKPTGCSHSWVRDNKRYIYSIRHLYGKEGSCTNYKAHCCKSLQSCHISSTEEGGCPFANYDEENLQSLLRRLGSQNDDIEDLVHLAAERKYQQACSKHLITELKKSGRRQSNFTFCSVSENGEEKEIHLRHVNNCYNQKSFIDDYCENKQPVSPFSIKGTLDCTKQSFYASSENSNSKAKYNQIYSVENPLDFYKINLVNC